MTTPLLRRLAPASELDRALARNVAILTLFVGIAGAARLAQESVIASKFGTGATVDAYYFVLTFLNWPVAVWFSALVVLVVPIEAQARRRGPEELVRFRSELLGLTLLVSIATTLLSVGSIAGLLQAGQFGLSPDARAAAIDAMPALAWLIPLGLPIGLLSTWILATGRQANTLIEATPALVVVACLLAAPKPTLAVLIWGTAGGFAVRLLVLWLVLLWRNGIPRPRFSFSAQSWSGFWRNGAAMVVGQILLAITLLVDQVFAARLGEGGVATLAYANRVILMIQALTALVAQRASLALLSESFAAGGAQARRTLPRWIVGMLLGGTALTAAGWLLTQPLVALLFERGQFTASNTERVSDVLAFGLFQLPFYLAGLIYVSAIAAQGHQALIGVAGALGCAVKLAANWILFPLLDLRGLQLATAVMYVTTFFFLHVVSGRLGRAAQTRADGG